MLVYRRLKQIFNQNEYLYKNYTKSEQVIAIYFHRKDTMSRCSTFEIDLSAGSYNLIWVDTKTGTEYDAELKAHPGGWAIINSPVYTEDIALKLIKKK